jgi:phage major head subunit gpT-like protein
MSPVMRGNFAELLGPGLVMNTFQFRRLPEFYRQVNNVQNSRKAYEDDWRMAGFGPLAEKTELGTTILDEPLKIGGVRFVHKTYALGFVISQEMRDDAQYPQILQLARELGTSSYWTTELYGHDVLNNGFVTTKYTGRDGLALFSTAHPIQGLGTTVGNRPAADTDISEAALEAAILSFETQTNERGMPHMLRPRTVLVHPSQRMLAKRFLNSAGFPGGNNNDINPLFDEGLRIMSDPWLTDQDAWFVLAEPQDLENALLFFWREMPDTKTWDDDNADGTFHKIRQRHSVGAKDWRGTYGSPGA